MTLKRKSDIWAEITRKINSTAKCLRTNEEIRKKWEDLKSKAKQKASKLAREQQKTGNEPLEDFPGLTDVGRSIIGFIGVEMVQGITGGLDTAYPETADRHQDFEHGEEEAMADTSYQRGVPVPVPRQVRKTPKVRCDCPLRDENLVVHVYKNRNY